MSGSKSLLELVRERVATGQVELPPAGDIAAKLQVIVSQNDYNIEDIIGLVKTDPALTTEVLRVANSAFYGGLSEIGTIKDAAIRLGPPEVVRLAMLTTQKGHYKVTTPTLQPLLDPLWTHAVATARGSQWLANKLGYKELESEAFIAGLLHDVGSLLLVKVIDDLARTDETIPPLSETLVLELITSAHTTEGGHLAQQWDLPQAYIDVIGRHHESDLSDAGTLINLVALADKACAQLGIGLETDRSIVLEAADEANTLGAKDILLAELSIMLEDSLACC